MTDPTTPSNLETAPVEVTQADRDAAAQAYHAIAKGYMQVIGCAMEAGAADEKALVQLFARHRLAHRTTNETATYADGRADVDYWNSVAVGLGHDSVCEALERLSELQSANETARQDVREALKEAEHAILDMEPAVAHMSSGRKIDRKSALAVVSRLRRTIDASLSTNPLANETGALRTFNLTWIAPPSAPLPDGRQVHPKPMTGRMSFRSFDEAVAFFRARIEGSEFASLTETISRTLDRSAEARAALASPDDGEG